MALAQAWYDNPDKQYRKACADLERTWENGVITASECAYGKQHAARYRDEAKSHNRKKEKS